MFMTPPAPRNWRIWMACATLCALQSAQAATPPAKPAPSITAHCPQPKSGDAFDAAFTEATVQRFSLQQLTCAAVMSASNAARLSTDTDMQMLALDSQINLLEALQLQLDTQTYQGGDVFEDIKARWALGIKQGKVLSARLAKAGKTVPSIEGIRIAFDLVSVSSALVDPQQALKVATATIKPLSALLEKNPKLLDGVGEMMLGRLYFQVPETSGGDLDQALVHLKKAYETNKKSIVLQRWYAESLVALGHKEEALQVLAKMLPLQPELLQNQSFADELRAGIGLAQRAGDPALSEQLTAKRNALLTAFPQLQTRQTAAISGHGGVDPLTGKSTD